MVDKELEYTDFEELVFEDRNKEYGAYDLRKSYKWFLTKAFFLGTVIFVAAIILPLVYVAATEGEKVKETQVDIDLLQHTEAPEEKLLKAWEGLGYYSRIRNMQKAAQPL